MDSARVVVGNTGAAAQHYLAKVGWTGIALVERDDIICQYMVNAGGYPAVAIDDKDVLDVGLAYRNGQKVWSVSSGGIVPATERKLAFADALRDLPKTITELQVTVFSDLHQAAVLAEPVLDSENASLRA